MSVAATRLVTASPAWTAIRGKMARRPCRAAEATWTRYHHLIFRLADSRSNGDLPIWGEGSSRAGVPLCHCSESSVEFDFSLTDHSGRVKYNVNLKQPLQITICPTFGAGMQPQASPVAAIRPGIIKEPCADDETVSLKNIRWRRARFKKTPPPLPVAGHAKTQSQCRC